MLEISGSDAAVVVDLYWNPDTWIRKLTESFVFDGDDVMTRSVTYEIEVPSGLEPVFHGYQLMPVGTVSRTPAKKVTIYSSHAIGTFPPVITRAEERNIFAKGFAKIMVDSEIETKEGEETLRKQILRLIDVLPLSAEKDSPTDPEEYREFEDKKWTDFIYRYPEFAVSGDNLRRNRAVIVPVRVSEERDCLQRIVVTYANAFSLQHLTTRGVRKLVADRRDPTPPSSNVASFDDGSTGTSEEPVGAPAAGRGQTSAKAESVSQSSSSSSSVTGAGGRHFDDEKVQSLTKEWNRFGPNRRLVLANSSGSSPQSESGDGSGIIYRRKHFYRAQSPTDSLYVVDDTYSISIPVNSLLDAKSYHAEISCPNGVYFEDSKLRVLNVTSADEGRLAEMIVVTNDECHRDRSHLYFSKALSKVGAEREDYVAGRLNIVLRPTFHNGLRSGMWISIMATATLVILILTSGLARIGVYTVVEDKPSKHQTAFYALREVLSVDPIVAVLLLALTVALGLIIRQREHFLTKAVYARYRARLFIITAAIFVSALVDALEVQGWVLMAVLISATLLSAASTAITIRSALYSKRRTRNRST